VATAGGDGWLVGVGDLAGIAGMRPYFGACYPIRHAVGHSFGDSHVYHAQRLVLDLSDRAIAGGRLPSLAAVDRWVARCSLPGAWLLWETTALYAGAWVRVYPGCWLCVFEGRGFADDDSAYWDYQALQAMLKNPPRSGVNLSDSLPI